MDEHPEFWENLPHEYSGGEELRRAELAYHQEQDKAFFWIPIAITDNKLGIVLPFSRSLAPGSQTAARPQNRAHPGTDFVKPEDVVRCAEEYFGIKDGAFLYNDDLGFVQFLGTIETPGLLFGTNKEFVVVGPDYSKNATQVQVFGGGIASGAPIPAAANPDNPRSYYFGNDVGGNAKWLYATHIHEIGNSLALLTGKFDYKPGSRPKTYKDERVKPNEEQIGRYGHDDPGVVFEDCVFGGQVRSDGTINKPK
jgi:hypothetical protein